MNTNSGSLFRLIIITILFVVNFLSLLRLLFQTKTKTCVHSFTYGLVLIVVSSYISIWVPYLWTSFIHGTAWPMIDPPLHCLIQQVSISTVMTMLLAILCLQKLFETFVSKRAKLLSGIIFFTWIFPQTIYSLISEVVSSSDNSDLYFMDGLNDLRIQTHSSSSPSASSSKYPITQGILFCIHRLDSSFISQMTHHYVVLVIPLTAMFIITSSCSFFAKKSLPDTLSHINCNCASNDIIVMICFCINFTWLLFARPMLALYSLLQNDLDVAKSLDEIDEWTSTSLKPIESFPLDIGQHVILFIIAILLPFSTRFGIFNCFANRKQMGKKDLAFLSGVGGPLHYLPRH